MEPNLAVSIYVRFSIKFLHFVPFHQQIWPPREILVSDWLLFKKIFFSETAMQNKAKLGRKHLCNILYKTFSLVPFGQQAWPPRLILFSDWLMLKKSSPLTHVGQMEPNMARRIYVRSKPGIDGPWVCPLQNCVRQPHPPFKMAAVF